MPGDEPMNPSAEGLLEREFQLRVLDDRLGAAAEGDGSLIVVLGPPGAGKSALLAATAHLARRRGLRVVTASGGELEIEFPFGIARQLFEPALTGLTADRRAALLEGAAGLAAPIVLDAPTVAGESSFALLHGLYWLTANLASEGPLVLIVDDAHWADRPSLEWLHYLGRRLGGLPVAVVVAARPAEPDSQAELTRLLAEHPDTHQLVPAPLSEAATGRLVGMALSDSPDDALVHACWQATRGNPFLIKELLRDVAERASAPGTDWATEISRIGPASISRMVLVRLARIGPDAVGLAQAAAVLGGQARLDRVGALAGLPGERAAPAADAMIEAGVLASADPVTFTHPVVQTAIYHDVPPANRAQAHARAADLLVKAGVEAEEVAVHLARAQPAGRPATVDVLIEVAGAALDRGARDLAIDRLERALAEPPEPNQLPTVLHLLGVTRAFHGDPSGISHLEKARQLCTLPAQRADIARDLAMTLMFSLRMRDAVDVVREAVDELRPNDPDAALIVEAQLLGTSRVIPGLHLDIAAGLDRMRAHIPAIGSTLSRSDRFALLSIAVWGTQRLQHTAEEAATLSLRALDEGALLASEPVETGGLIVNGLNLLFADRFAEARAFFDAIVSEAQRRASLTAYLQALCMRALVAYRVGDLLDGEADAQESLAVLETPHPFLLPMQLGVLVDLLVERGALADAEATLNRFGMTGPLAGDFHDSYLLLGRGHLRLAQGRPADAADDFLHAGRILLACDMPNPAILNWRSRAAIALSHDSRPAEAIDLADEELALTERFGAPRALGIALHARGIIDPDRTHRIELLQRAVDVLRPTPAVLEHARALTDLGAALRRSNRRVAAREPLRAAVDLADRCHATALAERATEELRATGAKPRRRASTGVEALTHSERRVAQHAAEGRSNRDIAQALFITVKTVEDHLSRSYTKLGISGRAELPSLLHTPPPSNGALAAK